MHQIDTATAAAAMPAPDVSVAAGFFTNGDPASATPPTTLSAYWLNTIMRELLNVLAAGGIAPVRGVFTQLRDAIAAMIAGSHTLTIAGQNWTRQAADGWIEQGGIAAASFATEASFTLNFNSAFPTACLGVEAIPINTGGSSNGDVTVDEESLSVGSALLYAQNEGSSPTPPETTIRWRAWGY